MSEVERWLRKQAAREQQVVLLEEALLAGRFWRYSAYRLRFFFARYAVATAAHTVTVLFLFRALAWESFLLVVLVHAATALVSSFWWGALEGLRARVRELHRGGKPHRIPNAIGGWLLLAGALAAAVVGVAAGFALVRGLGGEFGAAEAFVVVVLLRLALELPARCYHSGVYAIRRVYLPLPATLAPELLALTVMLSLWPFVEAWALVAGSAVGAVGVTGVSVRYTHRVYRFLGFRPLERIRRRDVGDSFRGAGRDSLAGGASHAVMALDSLAVLALLHTAGTESESLVVLFLVAPTIRAGVDWARLLYFDLKRLELRLFTNLRRRFERHTLELAWSLGLVFWVSGAGLATAFYGGSLGGMYVALLAFFAARALLARAQIQAFAEGGYAALVSTGVLCLGGLGAVGPLASGETERLGGVALVTALCAAALTRLRQTARARGEPGTALLPLEWLHRLGHDREAVRVGSARLTFGSGVERLDARSREERLRWRLAQIAERTARRLGAAGAAAWIGPDRIVWFEPAGGASRITPEWLQGTSGGLIAAIDVEECVDGEEALLAAGRRAMLGNASPHLLQAVVPVDVAAARATFASLIRGGVVYAPDEPVPPELAALPAAELRAILVDAATFARDLRSGRRRSRFDVTALCAGGELRLIFVADPSAGRRARGRWRHLVTTLNIRATIGGVVERRPRKAEAGIPAFLRA